MKKSYIILLTVVAIIAVVGMGLVSSYNKMVVLHENIDNAHSKISVQLERRADLIPNLVNTVKGFTDHENEVLDKVTEARKALVNAKTIEEQAEANNQLTNALSSLNVIVENYPDLKSSENFLNLQDELAGTENRVATARNDYNNAVETYNKTIKKIPTVFIAGMFGYHAEDYFEVPTEKTEVPQVNFGE